MFPNFSKKTLMMAAVGCFAFSAISAHANVTPGFNTKIPKKILTPSVVVTRVGTLKFSDGMPDKATADKLFENLDFIRGVEVFLSGIPAASLEAIRQGLAGQGVKRDNQVMIFDHLMNSNSLFLTGNTDTVYAMAMLNLKRSGPVVIEVPKGIGPGTVNDAWFRFVVDMGPPGPDKGQGGKYLILPPGYKGKVPAGYFVGRSKSYVNLLILRGFLVDGKPTASAELFKKGLKIYPLKDAKRPKKMEFISGSSKIFNTIHANNFHFYKELNQVIQTEPVGIIGPHLRGLIANIGIQKGKPFKPDARMKTILKEAVAVGNATARAIAFQARAPKAYLYKSSHWKTPFVGGDYRWLIDNGKGGYNLNARAYFFYIATVNTPAMAAKLIGKGSKYAWIDKDKSGQFLKGDQYYKLRIPANVPAKNFWSVVVYDPQTRSELQTGQPFPSKNNKKHNLTKNKDGSITLYFGPKSPKGKENNWIQTVPGKNWFAILRLYGPLEPWYNKTWRPGEIEPTKI